MHNPTDTLGGGADAKPTRRCEFGQPAIDVAHDMNWLPYFRRRCIMSGLTWAILGLLSALGVFTATGISGVARWLLAAWGAWVFLHRLYWFGGSVRLSHSLSEAAKDRCAIAFFRRFGPEHAAVARYWVIPYLEGYGRVTFALDRYFSEVGDYGLPRDSEGTVPFEGQRLLADETWKDEVRSILGTTDLVVFDISDITESLLWEISEALRHVPANRIVLISEEAHDPVSAMPESVRAVTSKASVDFAEMHGVIGYSRNYARMLFFRDALHFTMISMATGRPSANLQLKAGYRRLLHNLGDEVTAASGYWPVRAVFELPVVMR